MKYNLGFFWRPKNFNSFQFFTIRKPGRRVWRRIRKSHDDKYGSNGEGDTFESNWNRAMASQRFILVVYRMAWETVNRSVCGVLFLLYLSKNQQPAPTSPNIWYIFYTEILSPITTKDWLLPAIRCLMPHNATLPVWFPTGRRSMKKGDLVKWILKS